MTYEDLLRSDTSANRVGGVIPELLVAPIDKFLAIIAPPATAPIGDGASRVITGDHTFAGTDGFVKIQLSKESVNKFMDDPVGEADNGGDQIKGEFVSPGLSTKQAEFFANAKWEDWMVLLKLPTGKYIQIGTEDLPAKIKGNYGSGAIGEDVNGWTVNVSAFNQGLIFYEGTITLQT